MDGLANNMHMIVKEFCEFRGLTTLKLFLTGPPGSGKSLLADKLSHIYNIPHLHVK